MKVNIKNWTLIRKLQLGMGLFCLGDFLFYSQEGAVLLLGAILLVQAITDFQLGCTSAACRLPKEKYDSSRP